MIRIQNYNPNLTEIAERVLLGPQADILEKINQFNHYYQTDLKCTKTFRWSPGVSHQIKEAYERFILRWDMKYSGIEQFFKRIENRDYTHKGMARTLNDINSTMTRLRRDGLSMQDNADIVESAFVNTKEHILKELKLLEDIVNSSKFLINIYIDTNDESGIDYYVIKIVMRDYIMEVVDDHGTLAEIPLYPVALECRFSVFDHINKICSGREGRGNPQYYGEYLAPSDTLKFTFIANWNHNADGLRNVCLGGLDGDIKGATYNFNISGLAILLEQWITRFHKDKTQPHNPPNTLFYGVPKWLKDQDSCGAFEVAYPNTTNAKMCGVPKAIDNLSTERREHAIANDTTCNDIGCALRDACLYYRNVVNIDEDRLMKVFYLANEYENPYTISFIYRDLDITIDKEVIKVQQQELEDDEVLDTLMTDEERAMFWVEQQIERRNNG